MTASGTKRHRAHGVIVHRRAHFNDHWSPMRDDKSRVEWWPSAAQARRSLTNRGIDPDADVNVLIVPCSEARDGKRLSNTVLDQRAKARQAT